MTLVKFNRNPREAFFPNLASSFQGNVFNDLLDRASGNFFGSYSFPPVNISESENAYEIHLASPGHKKENFDIHLEKDVLTISLADKEPEKEGKDESKKITLQEFRLSAFKRSFNLPEHADLESVHAEYTDGILIVNIAKKKNAVPQLKKIEIS